MQLSAQGRAFLEQREGFRLGRYFDTAGRLTIGVGHLLTAEEIQSDCLHGTGFRTFKLTPEQVDQQFAFDVQVYEGTVNRILTADLEKPIVLSQNSFDACVALCFNIGIHGFDGSGVAHCLRSGTSVDDAWKQWNKIRNQATHLLEVDPGLVKRRQYELNLFHTPDPVTP